MISISKDKNSIRILLIHPETKRRYYIYPGLSYSKRNMKRARDICLLIESDIEEGNLDFTFERYKINNVIIRDNNVTKPLSEFIEFYLSQRYDLNENTKSQYRLTFNKFIKINRNKKPNSYNERDVKYYKDIFTECSQTHERRELKKLHDLFEWFRENELSYYNPFKNYIKGSKTNRNRTERKGVDIFSEKEKTLILMEFNISFPEYYPFVYFLFNTGCRIGEAVALQWYDVELKSGKVNINKTYNPKHKFSPAKSGNAREFGLDKCTLEVLRDLYSKESLNSDFVFSVKSLPINAINFRNRVWKKVLERRNIPYRKPYVTRHTFVTEKLKNGNDPITIASITGHSVRTLLQEYSHHISEISLEGLK